ncbi:MAG: hypothetical protein K2X27_19470 [Candidatus Obscuribacterales bacterium]|nr:hypothetical protein [Candidatus Obscuribacterales bacterium]
MPSTLSSTGVIKSMRLPESYTGHSKSIGGNGGEDWIYSHYPGKERYPEISVRYSGFPFFGNTADGFRNLLKLEPQVIFDASSPRHSREQNQNLVREASLPLGNSGNNQIFNTKSGNEAPIFFLEKMEVQNISQKNVLRVQGYFHGPDKAPQVFLDCVFIDADPKSEEVRIEELYLETDNKGLFDAEQANFEQVLKSIDWQN